MAPWARGSLVLQLARARAVLGRTVPVFLKLKEKTADALSQQDQHLLDRDQAVEERLQIQGALQQAHSDLQDAGQQIGDLNIQATILNSELGVLREKLSEGEEERAQLERKVTELSATISSTLASYTFLEQALASESAMLEALLGPSEQRVCELSEALANSEQQLMQLQGHAKDQAQQLLQLGDVCTKLSSVEDMKEFLQLENDLMMEQVAESECMLQGLRERNIQCEDLKGALSRLQLEKASVEEQLEATRSRASNAQQSLTEQLAQGVTAVTVQLHKLKGLTKSLHRAPRDQNSESGDGVRVTTTTPGPECLLDRSSFKEDLLVVPSAEEEDEAQGLDVLFSTISELVSTLEALRQSKEAQLEEMQSTICGLQKEHQATASRQSEELVELTNQLSQLTGQVEKGNIALQQKKEVDQTLVNLVSEVNEACETVNKHKTENLAQVEAQVLRVQLHKMCPTSTSTALHMDEKILLLQEVEMLKQSLGEEVQARIKILEKAKRHRTVYEINAQRMESELAMLDNMVAKVGKTLMSIPEVVQSSKELRKLPALAPAPAPSALVYITEPITREALGQVLIEDLVPDELEDLWPAEGAAPSSRHQEELALLTNQLSRLTGQVEKGNLITQRTVYEINTQRMESELAMLDNMVGKVGKTLMSIPEVFQSSKELRKLVDYFC
ncbi:hypothetical protein NHX12_018690 [Muraenolepis orangiensis]|uniref:Uncharacterized protein n=1 Tax=Muraenolepis orangiensis TaxID=630683 RepID=A0A9Q0F123_9TELE|nr:hypothetical protein NHX12_018690 [Muraenolepis orangiensis]